MTIDISDEAIERRLSGALAPGLSPADRTIDATIALTLATLRTAPVQTYTPDGLAILPPDRDEPDLLNPGIPADTVDVRIIHQPHGTTYLVPSIAEFEDRMAVARHVLAQVETIDAYLLTADATWDERLSTAAFVLGIDLGELATLLGPQDEDPQQDVVGVIAAGDADPDIVEAGPVLDADADDELPVVEHRGGQTVVVDPGPVLDDEDDDEDIWEQARKDRES